MGSSPNPAERRLVLVIGAVVFVDTMFYAAIAPLLPTLAHQLHLSKLSAGLDDRGLPDRDADRLASGRPARVARRPQVHRVHRPDAAGVLDTRVRLSYRPRPASTWRGSSKGRRRVFLDGRTGMDRGRGTARAARGLIGGALGAAIGGALFGPVIGTIAAAVGRSAAFSGVVVLAVILIDQARRLPSPHTISGQGLGHLFKALSNRGVAIGMWLVTLPAIASGLLNVLGPLRLHQLGATAVGIGATFVIATAVEAVVSPTIGRLSDRRGRWLPLRFGLAAATVVLVCFTLPSTPIAQAVVVVAIAVTLGAFWAPAMALLSEAADVSGLDQGLAAALMNVAWAGGQILGSGGGGAVAKSAGDTLPFVVTAGLCATTLVALGVPAAGRRRTAARSYGIPE